MLINRFIDDFKNELDEEQSESLNPETIFRDLNSWDSLTALSIIAMLDDKYEVNLKADEMRAINTLQELFNLVNNKKKNQRT